MKRENTDTVKTSTTRTWACASDRFGQMLLSTFRSATRLGGSCATRRFHLTNPYLLASRFASSDNAHPSHVGSVGFYKKHILVGIGGLCAEYYCYEPF